MVQSNVPQHIMDETQSANLYAGTSNIQFEMGKALIDERLRPEKGQHRGVARRGSGVVPDPAATQTTPPPPPPSPTHNIRSQLKNGTSQSTSHSVLVYSPKNKYAVQVYVYKWY